MSGKERKKFLGQNIILFTLSDFGPKILSFFLVSLYTNCLTTQEYGTIDLISTTASLFVPIFTININAAVLRYTLDKDSDSDNVIIHGLKITMIGTLLLTSLAMVFRMILQNRYPDYYYLLIISIFFVSSIHSCLTQYVRGINKLIIMVIASFLFTIVNIGLNILFLLIFNMKMTGYFIAFFSSYFVSIAIMYFASGLYKMKIRKVPLQLSKEMNRYAIPLIFNTISWWFVQSSDKYILLLFHSAAIVGVYSVSYKIPSILNALQSVFANAWQISAITDYQDKDAADYFGKIYSLYTFAMTISCSVIIVLTFPIAKFLYAKDFFDAWRCVAPLLLSVLFGAMSGFIGSIFFAVKDTKIFSVSTVLGMITNIILNFLLIPKVGALGAALATMLSYMIIWIFREITIRKYIKLNVNYQLLFLNLLILFIQMILLNENIISYIVEVFAVITLLVLNRIQVFEIYKKLTQFINEKMKGKN